MAEIHPVDFDDIEYATAVAARIVADAERCGIFSDSPDRQSDEAHRVAQAARAWLHSAQRSIATLSPGKALALVEAYELIHTIAHGVTAPGKLIGKHILAAFEARLKGDHAVDEYLLYRLVGREIRRRNPDFLGKPLQWHSLALDRWWHQFQYGVSLTPLSDYDTANRVAILLAEDLTAYEGPHQTQFKQLLLTNHPQLLCHHNYFGPTSSIPFTINKRG